MIRQLPLVLFLLFSLGFLELSFSGVGFEGALGVPSAQIENPDGSKANYSGIALNGRLSLPLFGGGVWEGIFLLNMKYLDLNNNSSSNAQRETGNHLGPGAGLRLRWGKLIFGADYNLMKARHFWVGETNAYREFSYSALSYYAGLTIDISKILNVAISYSMTSASIPKSDTELEKDSPFADQIIWLHLTYSTKQSTGKFFSSLFK